MSMKYEWPWIRRSIHKETLSKLVANHQRAMHAKEDELAEKHRAFIQSEREIQRKRADRERDLALDAERAMLKKLIASLSMVRVERDNFDLRVTTALSHHMLAARDANEREYLCGMLAEQIAREFQRANVVVVHDRYPLPVYGDRL